MTTCEEEAFREMERSYAEHNAMFLQKEEEKQSFNWFLVNEMENKE